MKPTSSRAPFAVVLLALLALVAAACSSASPTPTDRADGGAATTSPDATPPVASTTTTEPPVPDALPDPGVGPGECKVLTYTPPGATDPMPGELCRPAKDQRDVAVLVVHGGSGIGGSYANMRRWARRYLVEGYVTFLPEYHLFNPGGESPVFPKPEQHIKAAVQYLRGVGNAIGIQKDHIVVQGQSAGARVGAVAFTTPDDPFFAGPQRYEGISDEVNAFIGFYHPYDGTMQYADQYFGGPEASTDPGVVARLDEADSLSRATDARGPALFIVGSDDWDVIDAQQDAFAATLRANGRASTTLVIKGGGHGFDEGGERLSKLGEESAVATLTFLNDSFPQDPSRSALVENPDLSSAPTYTGVPPTTYVPRPAPSGGYGNAPARRSTTTTYRGASPTTGRTGGAVTSSTAVPSTTSAPTTMAPTTAAPTTDAPPVTTAPVTTSPPTTSRPSTTVAVTTSPPTTAAP